MHQCSIRWVEDNLWIANENKRELKRGIIIVDKDGKAVGDVNIRKPINIYYNPKVSSRVWVGTKQSSSGRFEGAVVAINKDTHKIEQVITDESLVHPTGMFIHQGKLYVGEQTSNNIHIYDLDTGVKEDELDIKPYISGALELLELSWT